MRIYTTILFGFGLLVVGCTQSTQGGGFAVTDSGHQGDTSGDTSSEGEYIDVFDKGKILSIQVELPPDEWAALQKNARDEAYVPVQAVIDGNDLGEVGMRFKGSYGALYNCFDSDDNMICPKLSLKLKFSEYDSDKRYQGLKRLNLHAMARDETLMHDALGYKAFRDAGIITSRTSYAELSVNGELMGLYVVVEQQDGRFTDDRFLGNGDGNLYKEVWPATTDTEVYQEKLKTNEELADHQGIVSFTTALQGATDAELPTLVSNWVDVNYWTTYLAVNEAMNNWDGVGIWYCAPGTRYCGPHNFYLYQEEERPFFWLMPWDLDSTFILNSWNGYPPRWNDLSVDCSELVFLPENGFNVMPPSCDPLFRGIAMQDPQLYVNALDTVLATVFSEETLLAQIDELEALLTPAVERDPVWDVDGWRGSVDQLRANIPLLRQRLMLIRDGQDVSPSYLSLSGVNDFEATNTIGILAGCSFFVNSQSSGEILVNQNAPLAGTKDFRFNFTFRNEGATMYGDYAVANMNLSEMADLTDLQSVRIAIRSDGSRQVQLGLISPLSTGQEQGLIWGWNLEVTDQPQVLELPVSDLSMPWWYVVDGTEDDLAMILTQVNQLRVSPYSTTRAADGLLPEPETGFVELDNIEFVFTP